MKVSETCSQAFTGLFKADQLNLVFENLIDTPADFFCPRCVDLGLVSVFFTLQAGKQATCHDSALIEVEL